MKDIKEFINEGNSQGNALHHEDIKYAMVSVTVGENVYGYVFKSISEIEKVYKDFDFPENHIKQIIDDVKKLKPNESTLCTFGDESYGDYEIITRIK